MQALLNLRLAQPSRVEAIQDVFSDRTREEAWLLLHDGELLLMVPLGINLLDVLAIEEHFAADWIVKALNQGNDAGLAAA